MAYWLKARMAALATSEIISRKPTPMTTVRPRKRPTSWAIQALRPRLGRPKIAFEGMAELHEQPGRAEQHRCRADQGRENSLAGRVAGRDHALDELPRAIAADERFEFADDTAVGRLVPEDQVATETAMTSTRASENAE